MNREDILRRFEGLLDEALASEEPPAGIEAELLALAATDSDVDRQCDSYALWAAMSALTQEIKLQGRAFKDLSEAIGSQTENVAREIRAAYEAREREAQRQAEYRTRREVLGALVDLRDRLARGLQTATAAAAPVDASRGSWLDRIMRRTSANTTAETASALLKGYQLSLERLDALLDDFNAREIPCQGLAFDPHRMNAIDLEDSDTVPDGTVLEVYRSGYEWNGEVFRPAQVKVSRVPERILFR